MGYHLSELIPVVVPQPVLTEFGIHHRLLGDTRLEPPCDLNLSLSGNTYFTPSCCCGEKRVQCGAWLVWLFAMWEVKVWNVMCLVWYILCCTHIIVYAHCVWGKVTFCRIGRMISDDAGGTMCTVLNFTSTCMQKVLGFRLLKQR